MGSGEIMLITQDQIRNLRKNCGMSRENFARLFLVSPISITAWENGSRKTPAIYLVLFTKFREKVFQYPSEEKFKKAMTRLMIEGGLTATMEWLYSNEQSQKHSDNSTDSTNSILPV